MSCVLVIYLLKKEAPDLILVDPAVLKREFGIIGEQLFAESWGVDRSIISHKYHPKTKSYGNSQVLQRDYFDQRQIEIVIREVGEQVAARIRAHNLRSACVNLFIGYAFGEADYGDHRGGFNVQKKSLLLMLVMIWSKSCCSFFVITGKDKLCVVLALIIVNSHLIAVCS